MSRQTVQQVKALITTDLSTIEKAQLIEWLGAELRQALAVGEAVHQDQAADHDVDRAYQNGGNGTAKPKVVEFQGEQPWEEKPCLNVPIYTHNIIHMSRLLEPHLVIQPY